MIVLQLPPVPDPLFCVDGYYVADTFDARLLRCYAGHSVPAPAPLAPLPVPHLQALYPHYPRLLANITLFPATG